MTEQTTDAETNAVVDDILSYAAERIPKPADALSANAEVAVTLVAAAARGHVDMLASSGYSALLMGKALFLQHAARVYDGETHRVLDAALRRK